MLFTDNYDKLNRAGGVTLAVDIIMVETRVRKFKMRECQCCGKLLLSFRYPERYGWSPVCPDCGGIMLTDFKIK